MVHAMSDTSTNSRNAARASTNYLAGLEWRRGVCSARVLDISMTGARLATHEQIAIGESVILTTVRMGARPGVVVRFGDGEVGIRFTDEISRNFEASAAKPH